MLNLSVVLENSARQYPKRVAVIFNQLKFTYEQVNAMTNQVANGLQKMGIGPNDKVALSCPNLPYFPIIYYGILKTGAVVVPFNVLLKRREIAYHLNDSDAKAYFCFEGTPQLPMAQEGHAAFQEAPGCEQFIVITAMPGTPGPIEGAMTLSSLMAEQPPIFDTVQTNPDDTAVILYTSGTTGQPKGAELSHFNMFFNAVCTHHLAIEIHHQLNQEGIVGVTLAVLPLFHSFGQTTMMNAIFYPAGTVTLMARFDPGEVLATMERDDVNIFAGVPTIYWALLHYPEADKFDLVKIARNLRLASSGGAAMPVEVMRAFEEKFDVPILEGYGLSETAPVATFNHYERPRKPGSIGQAIYGIEIKIVDENDNEVPVGETGELVMRGHNVMKGYYKRPEETAHAFRNGWFHTGDVARVDEEGYYYIVDRIKDMIIRGGLNVYPREVEEVLMMNPAVSLAAVIGVPDGKYGEEIKAFIVLKQSAEATAEEIIAWSKENMAAYKYPRLVEFRDTLPMSATGKVLKIPLREGK